MGRIAVLDRAAYHGTDDPVLIHMTCFHRVGLHGASVSNDGNGIRDRRDFIELVGDHDTGDALALQAPHQLQKIGRISLIQSRSGLIQDQQLDILGQCLCDFHQLLLAHTQIFDQGIGVQIQTHTLHQFHGPLTGFLPVNEAVLYDLIAHKDILGNGKFGDHGQLLMDDDDSGVFRFLDVFELGLFSHVENLALVRTVWVDTGQDFHQGGFSGAVFAADRMDFTPPHFQRYAVQCANARKLLDDFPHLENDRIFHMQPPLIPLFQGRLCSSRFLWLLSSARRFQTQTVQRDVDTLLVIGSRHIICRFLYLPWGISHSDTQPAVLEHIDVHIVVTECHCILRTQIVVRQQHLHRAVLGAFRGENLQIGGFRAQGHQLGEILWNLILQSTYLCRVTDTQQLVDVGRGSCGLLQRAFQRGTLGNIRLLLNQWVLGIFCQPDIVQIGAYHQLRKPF